MFSRASARRVLVLLATVPLVSCGGDPPALTIADVEFTERELLGLSPDRRAHLAEITALTLAVNRGELVDRSVALRERAIRRSLVRALRAHHLLSAADVGDDVLAARYELDPEHELEVRHFVLLAERGFPEAMRDDARAKAEAGLSRVRAGETFEAVAAAVSEEPGAAERGGLLRPAREGMWVDEFWSAASALQPGEISGVVESPFGFHVLRLEDKRVVPFDEARDRVALAVAELIPPGPFNALRDGLVETIEVSESLSGWTDLPDDAPLASWDGEAFTKGDFRSHLRSEPAATEREVLVGGARTLEILVDSALESALARMALGLELAADEGAVAQVMDDWRVEAAGWAATLGLVGTTDPEVVRSLALSALGATGQNATVAREALARERGPLLRSLYTIQSTQATEG